MDKKLRDKFGDNSIAPIIAFDFDGTISVGGKFPGCGEVRDYAKAVINFLEAIGVKCVIYSSRDCAINQDDAKVIDDITPMIKFLDDNGIKYSAINKSVQFAPFAYNSRKIYAHMYVDDRGYGWVESKCSMIYVLHDILTKVLDMPAEIADDICSEISKQSTMCGGIEICLHHGAIIGSVRIASNDKLMHYIEIIKQCIAEQWA